VKLLLSFHFRKLRLFFLCLKISDIGNKWKRHWTKPIAGWICGLTLFLQFRVLCVPLYCIKKRGYVQYIKITTDVQNYNFTRSFLCGYETWCHVLRRRICTECAWELEEILKPKGDDVTVSCRKRHNEELCNLNSALKIILVVIVRRIIIIIIIVIIIIITTTITTIIKSSFSSFLGTACRLTRGCHHGNPYITVLHNKHTYKRYTGRSQWPCGLRSRSAAERLLGSWVRIQPGALMFVSCECLFWKVEVSATGRTLVERSPTDCSVCPSVIKWK
jgi:hypothetical protein